MSTKPNTAAPASAPLALSIIANGSTLHQEQELPVLVVLQRCGLFLGYCASLSSSCTFSSSTSTCGCSKECPQWKCWQAEHVAVVPAIFSPKSQDCSAHDNGVSVPVFSFICLLLIECLFIFHFYLLLNRMRTFDCVTQGHKQQRSRASSRNKNRTLRI